MNFRVVAVCSLGDGRRIHTKRRRKREAVIHSNSTRFVKLLLSICHHKSHFDLAFLRAVLPAQFCFFALHGRPRELRDLSSTLRQILAGGQGRPLRPCVSVSVVEKMKQLWQTGQSARASHRHNTLPPPQHTATIRGQCRTGHRQE